MKKNNIKQSVPARGVPAVESRFLTWGIGNSTSPKTAPPPEKQPLVEINFASHTLTVGESVYELSPKIYAFCKDLREAREQTGGVIPRQSIYERDYTPKNAYDMLKRLVGKKIELVLCRTRNGYSLHPDVKIVYSGQIGIRKTKTR